MNFLKISLNLREGTRKIGKGSIEFYPMWPVERIWGALFIFSGNIHKRPHLLVLPPVDSRDNTSIKVLSHKAEWVFVRKKRKQRNRNCQELRWLGISLAVWSFSNYPEGRAEWRSNNSFCDSCLTSISWKCPGDCRDILTLYSLCNTCRAQSDKSSKFSMRVELR